MFRKVITIGLILISVIQIHTQSPQNLDQGFQQKDILQTIKSTRYDQSIHVNFKNDLSKKIEVFWIDYSGKEKYYKTLQIGQNYTQQTYVTHPWLFKSEGENIALFYPYFNRDQSIIIDDEAKRVFDGGILNAQSTFLPKDNIQNLNLLEKNPCEVMADKKYNCKKYVNKGYCIQKYVAFMQGNCAKSCCEKEGQSQKQDINNIILSELGIKTDILARCALAIVQEVPEISKIISELNKNDSLSKLSALIDILKLPYGGLKAVWECLTGKSFEIEEYDEFINDLKLRLSKMKKNE